VVILGDQLLLLYSTVQIDVVVVVVVVVVIPNFIQRKVAERKLYFWYTFFFFDSFTRTVWRLSYRINKQGLERVGVLQLASVISQIFFNFLEMKNSAISNLSRLSEEKVSCFPQKNKLISTEAFLIFIASNCAIEIEASEDSSSVSIRPPLLA